MKTILIATAALMAGTAALAQTAPVAPAPPVPPVPMAHPAPMGDRITTRDEVVAKVREHFARLDADKNGSITKEEVMQGHMKLGENVQTFRMHRGEGEGAAPHVVMREGPMGDPNAAFDRLDANKDGSISREEFAKAHEQRIARRVELREERKDEAKDGKAEKHAFRMHRMGGMGGMGGATMIVMADTDKDGKITQAEVEALALQHFDQMDANHDGQVTPEERRAGRPMIIKKVEEKKLEL